MKIYPWSLAASSIAGLLLVPQALFFAGSLYDELFPVVEGWKVVEMHKEFRDIVMSGRMVKARNCRYVPPPIAVTESGLSLRVETAASAGRTSWPVADLPYQYGPWKIEGAAGHLVTFYLLHECNPFWSTHTKLGQIDFTAQANK